MKHILTLFFIVVLSNVLIAQQNINFHIGGTTNSYPIHETDSLYFNTDHTNLYFYNNGNNIDYVVSEIDSITFSSDINKNICIEYLESSVFIDNPLSGSDVDIEVDGANVTITSTSDVEEINYICTGATSNGKLKIYSEEKFNLLLNDVAITNPIGPAVNIQSKKRVFINLLPGTENILTDGIDYAAPPKVDGEEEDQKATLFSEGKIKFIGSGSLTVNGLGKDQHGICSDKELTIFEGNINIASSKKDGIHADGFVMEGARLMVTSLGDGIDGDEDKIEINCGTIVINSTSEDVKGITCDGIMTINGGEITLNISGKQSKGLKCDSLIVLNGGTIQGIAAGDVVLETEGSGFETSYCSMIKTKGDLIVNGATIDIKTTGEASRGISCDGSITIKSGQISIVSSGDGDTYTNAEGEKDAYHGACMKIDDDMTIYGGVFSLSNSGSGGKGISTDGSIIYGDGSSLPKLEIVTTGESITVTPSGGKGGSGGNNGDYDESKAMKADGSITIKNGTLQISSADDAIKSDESITFNNGKLDVLNCVEGLEAPNITINNGTITVAATDDGFNATQGTEVMNDDGSQLYINGGNITINMSGYDVDAIDSNGDITITGGIVYLNFPTQGRSEGLDANGTVTIGSGATVYENGEKL